MKTQATAKFVGTSARKTGLVAALDSWPPRSRRTRLSWRNTPKAKRATGPVGKVLASAVANAENNNARAKLSELIIESVLIGPGPTL